MYSYPISVNLFVGVIMIFPLHLTPAFPRIAPSGDRAVLVTLGSTVSPDLAARIRALRTALQSVPGIEACVPAYASLLVLFEPAMISRAALTRHIRQALTQPVDDVHTAPAVYFIPVCYGGSLGEDLPFVARRAGLSEEEVISLHSRPDYLIYMMGFLPGFAYLGGLDERLHTPRLDIPKTVIPAGSVGIGGSQTGLYPLDSPGGWHIIGRSPIRPYDPARAEPFLYQAGSYLHFVPVNEREYEQIQADVAAGTYHVEVHPLRIERGRTQ